MGTVSVGKLLIAHHTYPNMSLYKLTATPVNINW